MQLTPDLNRAAKRRRPGRIVRRRHTRAALIEKALGRRVAALIDEESSVWQAVNEIAAPFNAVYRSVTEERSVSSPCKPLTVFGASSCGHHESPSSGKQKLAFVDVTCTTTARYHKSAGKN